MHSIQRDCYLLACFARTANSLVVILPSVDRAKGHVVAKQNILVDRDRAKGHGHGHVRQHLLCTDCANPFLACA